jgi:hypothetical protein
MVTEEGLEWISIGNPKNVRHAQRKSNMTKRLKHGQRRRKTSRKGREEIWGRKGYSRHVKLL